MQLEPTQEELDLIEASFEYRIAKFHAMCDELQAGCYEEARTEDPECCDFPAVEGGAVVFSQAFSQVMWYRVAMSHGWELSDDRPVYERTDDGLIIPGTCRWVAELTRGDEVVKGVGFSACDAMAIATLKAQSKSVPVIHTPYAP